MTGHFAQADTIVPSAGNAATYNRFAYARYNPIKFNDPSGHDVGCGGRDGSNCSSYGRLSNYYVRKYILEKNNQLAGLVNAPNGITALKAYSQLTKYAASYTPNRPAAFVWNVSSITTGLSNHNSTPSAQEVNAQFLGSRRDGNLDKAEKFGQSGFAEIFQDPPENAGGDQMHHHWFYVQVGFVEGRGVSNAGVIAHETFVTRNIAGNSPQDMYLGFEGTELGVNLMQGKIKPMEVGDYILNTLSEGTETARYWHERHSKLQEAALGYRIR
jgi:hypothetical protein